MELWMNLLFGNAIGLMSMIVIFFCLGMAVFYGYYFINKAKEAEAEMEEQAKKQ